MDTSTLKISEFGRPRTHTFIAKVAYIHKKLGCGWCAISCKRIVRPIFFTSTIMAEVYQGMIQQFISLLECDERDTWFQQDSAHPHVAWTSMEMLHEFFGKRLISSGLWPPRSPDTSPLDFKVECVRTIQEEIQFIPYSSLRFSIIVQIFYLANRLTSILETLSGPFFS